MGWFGNNAPAKVSAPTQTYLEDLPPKFYDEPAPAQLESPKPTSVLSQIKISDFTVEKYMNMPCFRESMMTGFQAMAVLGGVTFLIRKDISKAMNWGVLGFFLGNVIGWEQCRSIRRRSFEAMEKARQVNREKNLKKWLAKDDDKDNKDARLDQFNKVQEYYNNKKK